MKIWMVFIFWVTVFGSCGKDDSIQEIEIKKTHTFESDSGKQNSLSKNNTSQENRNPLLKISSKEARHHIGDSLIVNGYVADVYLSNKVAYLNFENKFPKNTLAAAIFAANFQKFGELQKYKNKNVEVMGKITTFKSKPQIILSDINQIKITE